jgi:hypothetical protein
MVFYFNVRPYCGCEPRIESDAAVGNGVISEGKVLGPGRNDTLCSSTSDFCQDVVGNDDVRWVESWDPLSITRGPVFEDVEDVDAVYQLISALRAKTTEVEVTQMLRER